MRSLLLLTGALAFSAQAQTTRVLFIGNSLTYMNDLPGIFAQLATSMGEDVETAMVAPAGSTFQFHGTHGPTQAAIALGGWDFVVLQEQSQLPSFPPGQVATQVLPYAAQLVQQVHAASPCAEVVFLMTWGHENGDALNCPGYPPVCTYAGMQQRLRDSYVQMASDNSAWCAPTGAAWRWLRQQSPGTDLYSDQSHPNTAGSYLAACTLASTLFRRACTPATYQPAGMAVGLADTMRQMASSVVLDSTTTWNIGVNDPVAQGHWTGLGGNTVLFANNTAGAAAQTWAFGDGNSSTEADPLHTFPSSGPHEVTLVVTDDCGRTDTLVMIVDILSGIADLAGHAAPLLVTWCPAMRGVDLSRGPTHTGGQFTMYDAAGRTLATIPLVTSRQFVAIPFAPAGILLWQLQQPHGSSPSGRVVAY